MPVKRRRNSGQGEGNERETRGNRMSIDHPDALNGEKQNKGAKSNENSGTPKSSRTSRNDGVENATDRQKEVVPRAGAFTRSRVIKRPKRDLSPPESPVKKSVPKDSKANTPETKTKSKRQWELWSAQDKDTFFDALFEHGKDFDAIQGVLAAKCKRKGIPPGLVKNKDQVRHLYYRTWHKIAKYLGITDDVKKETKELYGLINYGALRKKIKRGILTEKEGGKLKELVHKGYTTFKIKGKTQRIKTPVCNALKKLNNVDQTVEQTVKVPTKIHIEMTPRSNEAWATVQEMALNPRMRMMLKSDRKLSSVVNYLQNKWKPHWLRAKEALTSEPEDLPRVLTVYPHKECDIVPVTLECISETRLNLALNNYREKILNQNVVDSSPTTKGRKGDVKLLNCDNVTDEATAVIFNSPHSSKCGRDQNPVKSELIGNPASVDVSALDDGDNAMFPDVPFSACENGRVGGETVEMFVESSHKGCNRVNVSSSPSGHKNLPSTSSAEDGNAPLDRLSDSSQDMEYLETQKTAAIIENGITEESADNLTLAEMYLMFGKENKLRLEYDWVQDKTAMLASNLTNILRRLVHLAAVEFTDFNTKPSTSAVSPCATCGALRSRSRGKGQRSQGRSPLSSKAGTPMEGFSDASTQTTGFTNKSPESSCQGKDPIFRVPICSPSLLQTRAPCTMASSRQINNLFPPQQKGIRKIRNCMRKPPQRNIMPRPVPQHMFTLVRPLSSPVAAIPLQMHNSPIPGTSQNVSTGIPGGTLVQLNVQPGSPPTPVQTLHTPPRNQKSSVAELSEDTISQLLKPISVEVSQQVLSSVNSMVMVNSPMVTTTTTTTSSLSPPSMSSILDISLSSLPIAAGSSESSDRLIDLALGNSNTFSALLNPKDDNVGLGPDSLLNTPTPKPPNSEITDSANNWLNGEENAELSFMNLLNDTPVKQSPSSSTGTSTTQPPLVPPLFSESSRDSIMGRLDVDYTLQSMMNESSMDYAAKFMDLAAHITGSSDNSLSNIKKSDSNG